VGLKLPSETLFYSIRCGARQSAQSSLFLVRTASQLDQSRAIRLHGDAQREVTMHAKRTLGLLFSLAIALVFGRATQAKTKKAPKSCWDTATTQLAMNECAGKELRTSEQRLSALLTKLGLRPDDPAQKAWEAYRDAQIEAIYPKQNAGGYGSVFPMCLANLEKKLTDGRIADLKRLITSDEGEVCSGLRLNTGRAQSQRGSLSAKRCLALPPTKVAQSLERTLPRPKNAVRAYFLLGEAWAAAGAAGDPLAS
jgi:uncharacterized protein YecT (DUF1311 family)